MTSIAPHIEAFLRDYLVRHRGNSEHTCESYAYSFQALFEFASQRLKVTPSSMALEQLDAALICSFLEYLEIARGNSGNTRNIRLAAIRSFFRFLQHREPAALAQVRRVLAIPFKRTDSRLVPYLDQKEVQALLDAPDPATRDGVRDRAMLHLAISAGLRVSELTGLRIDNIAPQSASIRVHGKGRRERALPLWKTTASVLRAWLAIRGVVAAPEGAAKLAANPAGEVPASRTCPVATVVIPDGGESDLSSRKLRSKSPSRQSASGVGSVRGASKSAGCSERSEPLAAKRRPTGSGLWWDG